MISKDVFRTNNLDLIRLFAALEVVLHHTLTHFDMHQTWLYRSTAWFPGVPVFFFTSGFLISKSFESNPRLNEYALNRALRIFPALIVCTTLSILCVFATGYLSTQVWTVPDLVVWFLGQVTIVQFYNPDFMRAFGVGVLNGSLWTITVELQFYVLIPLLYLWLTRLARRGWSLNGVLLALIALLALCNVGYKHFEVLNPEAFLVRLGYVTFIPWVFMFLLGILAQKNFELLYPLVRGRVIPIALAYGLIAFLSVEFLGWTTGNSITALLFPLLALTVLAAAFSEPTLARKVLRGNDVSYGVYIFHMPIINLLLYYGFGSRVGDVVLVLAITLAAAICSWFFIERVAIRKKRHPLVALDSGRNH